MPAPVILGQSTALDVLNTAMQSDRMHHAWIFSGPMGVGKRTAAVATAYRLLVPDPDDKGAAGLLDAGSHPDLHLIYKELALYSDNRQLRERKLLNIPLDLLRERMIGGRTGDDRMHEAAAYRTAALGHGKVFIIDEAELIDPTGQNSLLKTLEEPPRDTVIFLITSQPQRLLPTIRSRCQHVRFGPLDAESMAAWFAGNELDVTPDARAWIERFCDGSPGTAQIAARYGFARWQGVIEDPLHRLSRGDFPVGFGETLAALVDEFAVAWTKNHDNASKDAANKAGARHVLRLLGTHARNKLAECAGAGTPTASWIDAIDLLRDAERHLDGNVNLKFLFENLSAQWAAAAADRRASAPVA